jgi:FtsP/CotA-like multicopper oxidase with cupredoxin domain
MIGAHYMFEMGASDSPQIGTFEDFYMVNTLWERHPMHIHLINFQTVATYTLKSIP